MHGDHIHVALDKDTLVFFHNSLLGLIQAIKFTAFAVDKGFGRVHVFGHLLILAQSTATEGHHLAGDGEYGIHHPRLETVIQVTAVRADAKPRINQIFFIQTRFLGCVQQVIAFVKRISEMESLYCPVVDASFPEICQSYLPTVSSVLHIVLEMSHSEIIGRHHPLAVVHLASLIVGDVVLLNLDVIFVGQPPQSLPVGELLMLHDEVDRTATLAAAETLANAARW